MAITSAALTALPLHIAMQRIMVVDKGGIKRGFTNALFLPSNNPARPRRETLRRARSLVL
ncbi:hypothetical protein [Cupriavidus sp. WS]|uniref:hypothetical protein n=1 Tax=Cupriavidus sp. WS TaxID=1312922 RepID=UPI0012DF5A08|nr:hypothetical protein [Cupriavidus sp. WS]